MLQIGESLVTFGIDEQSSNVLMAVFDDEKGDKTVALAKKIKGRAVPLEQHLQLADYQLIKKVGQGSV